MTTRRDFLRTTAGVGAGAAIWAGVRFAVSVDGDSRHEDSAYLFEGDS